MFARIIVSATKRWRALWFVIFSLGVILRLLRLSWQPLWWDEGYSVYFATEPIGRMFWLTAQDIHPPLYYLLLNYWLSILGNSGPEAARLFSVFVGIVTLPLITWSSLVVWPHARWRALLALLLLAVNPLHIYYSQEVRMYALALLLTLLASTLLWQIQQRLVAGQRPYLLAFAYVVTAALALQTLYYTGFVLLAHQVWTLIENRSELRRQLWFWAAALCIILLQVPWWLYAIPKLVAYVADKVLSDQDHSLTLWNYLWRHWIAFISGALPAGQPWLEFMRQFLAVLVIIVLSLLIATNRHNAERRSQLWLLCLIVTPFIIAFIVNLLYPFFPEGGERLLLQLLPYLLLAVAYLVTTVARQRRLLGLMAWVLFLLAAFVGNWIFFTTPRYSEQDYRPIINKVVSASRPQDAVLALFPWQVGYWRAYSPRDAAGHWLPPQPEAIDQTILRWDDSYAAQLDSTLEQGTLWFPMPLSFGSSLPGKIEEHLQANARNLENTWFSNDLKLSAWTATKVQPEFVPVNATFGEQLTLTGAGIAPSSVTSSNTPLAVDLCWEPNEERAELRATLRLLDSHGRQWAQRDLTPVAANLGVTGSDPCVESVAFDIPVGLPPDTYELALGVGPFNSDQLYTTGTGRAPLVTIGEIDIATPEEIISPHRLDMQYRLNEAADDSGLRLLGYTGPRNNLEILSGDDVAMTLYLQNTVAQPPDRHLYLSFLNQRGDTVAGWQGWPLPKYPTSTWKPGALAQVPLSFYLPPDLEEGEYDLVAGFVDPTNSSKSVPTKLGQVQIVRRATDFARPGFETELSPPTVFGSHATLIGESLSQTNNLVELALTWQILQPLVPAHHIFVHLFDGSGNLIDQSDGEPTTATGRAPTGSWLPDEYITTIHSLQVPTGAKPPFTIKIGLDRPSTGERLPAAVDGITIGDSATITVTTAP